MDKYIQVDFLLPTQNMYGLGERIHEFGLEQGTYTMWNKGQDSPYDDLTGGLQVYGTHPFIMYQTEKMGQFAGIFFRNSNYQSPTVVFNKDGTSTLSYITTGGNIEAYFFIKGTPKEIIAQYHGVIGKPALPPFWALGWQQASWTYQDQETVEQVIANYSDNYIPLEVMWLDIPYMDNYADFSVDTKAFPDLQGLKTKLADKGQRLVVILDGGLSADDTNNEYYQQAM